MNSLPFYIERAKSHFFFNETELQKWRNTGKEKLGLLKSFLYQVLHIFKCSVHSQTNVLCVSLPLP